jgi:hypothetical protein
VTELITVGNGIGAARLAGREQPDGKAPASAGLAISGEEQGEGLGWRRLQGALGWVAATTLL